MKKFVLLLTVGLTLTTPTLWADDDDEDSKPVVFDGPLPNPNIGKIEPRSLTPVSGVVYHGVLELCFAVDMGTVIATVTNTATGEMWCESGNSNDGVLSVEITPTPGNYSVTIETENGDIYLGMFAL